MKTLDEVIADLECCNGGFLDDAIHYLKEYQEKCEEICKIAKIMADSWELRKQTMAFEDRNEPLTWDELNQMEGKPVWIEDAFEKGEWYIIECFTASNRFIAHDRWAGDAVFRKLYMGKEWQAYRKERE